MLLSRGFSTLKNKLDASLRCPHLQAFEESLGDLTAPSVRFSAFKRRIKAAKDGKVAQMAYLEVG